MSIYDNIAYGPRVHGIKDKKILDQIVEESLGVLRYSMKLKID